MQTHVWSKKREVIEALAPWQISIYLHFHQPPDIPGPPLYAHRVKLHSEDQNTLTLMCNTQFHFLFRDINSY